MRLIIDLTPRAATAGLAVDEALLESARTGAPDTLRVWVSTRAVVLGRSQSPESECTEDVARLGIPVVRRVSGGGAVVHYPGNLNVSLSVSGERWRGSVDASFARFGAGLVRGLGRLGVEASLEDRRIDARGLKVSGLAQARRGRGILVHATVLALPDSVAMESLLRAMQPGYLPAGTASRPRATTTLRDALCRDMSLVEVADAVSWGMAGELGAELEPGCLTPCEREAADAFERCRYRSREWNESQAMMRC